MRSLSTLVALVVATWLSGARPASAALTVVTTTSDLAAIATEVGGDKITVTSLAKGYQDPHFVEAKPSFVLLLTRRSS
jgi:zinc/manganese transport system substrate-binding protein